MMLQDLLGASKRVSNSVLVKLYKALGGGWPPAPQPAGAATPVPSPSP